MLMLFFLLLTNWILKILSFNKCQAHLKHLQKYIWFLSHYPFLRKIDIDDIWERYEYFICV